LQSGRSPRLPAGTTYSTSRTGIEFEIIHGVSAGRCCASGTAALREAAAHGHSGVLRLLLESGANTELRGIERQAVALLGPFGLLLGRAPCQGHAYGGVQFAQLGQQCGARGDRPLVAAEIFDAEHEFEFPGEPEVGGEQGWIAGVGFFGG
jgi:hypothetical protein